jgi:hypothetical protein
MRGVICIGRTVGVAVVIAMLIVVTPALADPMYPPGPGPAPEVVPGGNPNPNYERHVLHHGKLPRSVPGATRADRHFTFRRYTLTPGQVWVRCPGNDHEARCVVQAFARWVEGTPPSWREWEDHIVRHRQGWLVEASTGPRPFGSDRTTATPTPCSSAHP